MIKVKRVRTIDAVVTGYRPGKEAGTVGSLILGALRRGRRAARRRPLLRHQAGARSARCVERLAPYETGSAGSGDPSRWKSEKELEWIALRPELVVEVSFDQSSGGRIRHGTKILRWREDKRAARVHARPDAGLTLARQSGRASLGWTRLGSSGCLAELRRPGGVADARLLVALDLLEQARERP